MGNVVAEQGQQRPPHGGHRAGEGPELLQQQRQLQRDAGELGFFTVSQQVRKETHTPEQLRL